jgi:autotransporter-associated beta strand protein
LLSGNNNGTSVYSNGTTVSNGILNTTKAAALALYNSTGKVIIHGGTLGVQMGGAGWTTGQVDALLSAATKTSGALGIDTTNGNLTQWTAFTTTNMGPSLGLTKMGANNFTLSQSNTYAGPTKINSGTLIITGATQATSSIVMASNSSLGFVLGSPVSAPNAAVDFSNGNISITGAPSAPTHVLLTASSFTGTPALAAAIPGYELEIVGTQLLLKQTNSDAFAIWAGAGQAFDADANNDGVANGIAWVLGAADPTVSSLTKLPTAMHNAGDLVISFRCLNAASRGATILHLQHSSTLGQAAAWSSIAVPEVSGMSGGVNFAITTDGNFLQVTATIPATQANQGKIFARLSATP